MPQCLALSFVSFLVAVAGVVTCSGCASKAATVEKDALPTATTAGYKIEAGSASSATDPRFTLEIRRCGVVVDRFRQRALLMRLDEVGPKGTVMLTDPKDYEWSFMSRMEQFGRRSNNIVSYTVLDWVDYWPIPTVIVGPPMDPTSPFATQLGAFLGDADNGSGVANSFYIRVSDLYTADGSEVVDKLFKLFDEHPDLPAVFVLVQDGANTRAFTSMPGGQVPGNNDNGNFVPTKPDAIVGLMVTRTDRIDRMIRPFATETHGILDKTKTQFDVVKLSNFYWKQQRAYPKPGYGVSDPTADYWQAKLPEFYKTESLKFPKGFTPNPWVPVPWTSWQLKEYDQWPVLAYLHRPVRVVFSSDRGTPVSKNDKIKKLRNGWEQAVATLPQGAQPERMLYDTGALPANFTLLEQSLAGSGQTINLDDPADTFDMQSRIGADTGISSTFVQIALATMMGYGDGKANALVSFRDPEHATITMVTPPDESSRKAKPQTFSWSVPQ